MTVSELRDLRERKEKEHGRQGPGTSQVQIIIGMGTSGIAAGAKEVMKTFSEVLEEHEVQNAQVRKTGSLGLDHAEPTVEVAAPGMPRVIYGQVDEEVARQIVERHILEGELVDKHVYDRPAPDALTE